VFAVLIVLSLVLAAPAHASNGSGGATPGPLARAFTAAPATVAPAATVTFAFRATPGALARVDLLTTAAPPVRIRLGRVPASGTVRATWPASAAGGTYTARLVITSRGATSYARAPLVITAPASLTGATSATFPVQGPYTFGGPDSRFGAGRTGHIHQGQDIAAAEGTPVVSPVTGSVSWVAYQAKGAGYYVVVAGADGRHYVFMHFQEGSTAVTKEQPVVPGQRLGNVGATGDAQGPHLHFEIWVNGWWLTKASTPIDPLPDLQAWAAASPPSS
jgi:murein DD-endopeptidase MepM/ murein hydrolase activator NlpD